MRGYLYPVNIKGYKYPDYLLELSALPYLHPADEVSANEKDHSDVACKIASSDV